MLKSMRIGDEAEREVIDFLSTLGCIAIKNEDKDTRIEHDIHAFKNPSPYDSCVTPPVVKFEVKNDVMAEKTGNIALEYYNSKSNKPSGITATRADWWVHKIAGELWIIRVSELINFTKNEKPVRMISGGGDDNADLMLYRIETFTAIASRLSDITSWEQLK